MKKADFIELGYIAKAHGLKGELKAVLDVHDLNDYRKVKQLYLARKDGPIKEWKIKRIDIQSQKQIFVAFEGIEDRNTADEMVGYTIYFPESELPTLPEGQFYYFETIGYQVEDAKRGALGKVKDFFDGAAQDLLQMEYEGKEVLIPMTLEFVLRADHASKTIHTDLPEGLLEFYLGEEEVEEE